MEEQSTPLDRADCAGFALLLKTKTNRAADESAREVMPLLPATDGTFST